MSSSPPPAPPFRVKWHIEDARPALAIVLQNSNGPCPLLALANALLLSRTIIMPQSKTSISCEELLSLICQDQRALALYDVLPLLAREVPVDLLFHGTTEFVPSPELQPFGALGLRLVHAAIPDDDAVLDAVSGLSYNGVVDALCQAASASPFASAPAPASDYFDGEAEALRASALDAEHVVPRDVAPPPKASEDVVDGSGGASTGAEAEVEVEVEAEVEAKAEAKAETEAMAETMTMAEVEAGEEVEAEAEAGAEAMAETEVLAEVDAEVDAMAEAEAGAEAKVDAEVDNYEEETSSADTESVEDEGAARVIENAAFVQDFLDSNPSMMTWRGLAALHETLAEGEVAVLFYAAHFAVVRKHKGRLFTLVTDAGFLSEVDIMYESLDDIGGNTQYFNAKFGQPRTGAEDGQVARQVSEQVAQQVSGQAAGQVRAQGVEPAGARTSNLGPAARASGSGATARAPGSGATARASGSGATARTRQVESALQRRAVGQQQQRRSSLSRLSSKPGKCTIQ